MSVSVIIPCYNEELNVAGLVEGLMPVVAELRRCYGFVELIFVDDGSIDETWHRLWDVFGRLPDVQLLQHPHNEGLGAALRTGFKAAQGDIIVTTDSDATYAYHTIGALLDQLMNPGIAIVIASPYAPGGAVENVPGYRLLLSKGASTLYRLLLDSRVHTYTGMYRAYRREVLETIGYESNDFLAVTEILVRAIQAGFSVAEYPTTLRVRKYGQSKARIARITLSHLRFQWRLVRQRLSHSTVNTMQPVIAVGPMIAVRANQCLLS